MTTMTISRVGQTGIPFSCVFKFLRRLLFRFHSELSADHEPLFRSSRVGFSSTVLYLTEAVSNIQTAVLSFVDDRTTLVA